MSNDYKLNDGIGSFVTMVATTCISGFASGIRSLNIPSQPTPPAPITGNTITIGTGTLITATSEASPINVWYTTLVAQIVYTKNEINNAGGIGPFTIKKLGWYIAGLPTLAMPNYTIKLKHVTVSNVSNSLDSTGWTTVCTIPSYKPTILNNYDLITLTTPFTWNGVDNIGLEVCWNDIGSYSTTGRVQYTNTTDGFRFSRADYQNYCGRTTGNISFSKPNIRIEY